MKMQDELIAKAVRENLSIGVNGDITVQQLLQTKNIFYKKNEAVKSFANLLDERYTALDQKVRQNPVSLLDTTVNLSLDRDKLEMEVIKAFISERKQEAADLKALEAEQEQDAKKITALEQSIAADKLKAVIETPLEIREQELAKLKAKYGNK